MPIKVTMDERMQIDYWAAMWKTADTNLCFSDWLDAQRRNQSGRVGTEKRKRKAGGKRPAPLDSSVTPLLSETE